MAVCAAAILVTRLIVFQASAPPVFTTRFTIALFTFFHDFALTSYSRWDLASACPGTLQQVIWLTSIFILGEE
jgi:hypothetical protein